MMHPIHEKMFERRFWININVNEDKNVDCQKPLKNEKASKENACSLVKYKIVLNPQMKKDDNFRFKNVTSDDMEIWIFPDAQLLIENKI